MRSRKFGLFSMSVLLAASALASTATAQERDRHRGGEMRVQRERGMQVNRQPARAPEARPQRAPEVRPQRAEPRPERQVREAPMQNPAQNQVQNRTLRVDTQRAPQGNVRTPTPRQVDQVRQGMGNVIGRDAQRYGDNNRDRDRDGRNDGRRDDDRRNWDRDRDHNGDRDWNRDRDRDRDRDRWNKDRDHDRGHDRDRDRWRDHNRRPIVIVRPSPSYHYRPHWWGTRTFYFDNRYYGGGYDYDSWYRPGYGFYGAQHGSGWAVLDPWLRQDPASRHWVMWNFDSNRNGQLGKDEARRANREFSRLADRNRDGYLSDGEIRFGVEELRDEYRYSFNY